MAISQPQRNESSASQIAHITSEVDLLLDRMRQGDREAAAEFITRFGPQIRRRIRRNLGQGMRRLFDSQEILSTISRRLDAYILTGQFQAVSEGHLWNVVHRITDHALVDKARVTQRITTVEAAHLAMNRPGRLEEDTQNVASLDDPDLDRLLQCISDPLDQQILQQWLLGRPHSAIAETVGLSHDAVRKRWQRLTEKLRERMPQDKKT